MIDISLVYFASFLLARLFEVVHVLCGIIVLALVPAVPPGRKGIVAAGGVLLLVSTLGDLVLRGWTYLFPLHLMYSPAFQTMFPVLRFLCTLMFVGALLTLVLAAIRRPGKSAVAPPPPAPGPRPFPTP